MGNAENVIWRELKEKIKAERGAKCELCGSLGKLDLHHIISRKNNQTFYTIASLQGGMAKDTGAEFSSAPWDVRAGVVSFMTAIAYSKNVKANYQKQYILFFLSQLFKYR